MELPFGPYDAALTVTVLVVNWNGREHLEDCLLSLQGQTLAGVEILLIDNGSTDGSIEFVRSRFAAVRILSMPTNLGYGAALNAGIRAARGRFVLALNNDVEVHPGCLAALVESADRHPNAGVLSPKILFFRARDVLDNAGNLFYPDGVSRGRGRLERDRGQYDREEDILLPSGCAMLLRRAMLADVGLFDEEFFAYCEDTDLALRARLAGWSCRFVPAAVVYHKYSASAGEYSPFKAFLVERNRSWVAVRCFPAPLLLLSPLFSLLRHSAMAWAALVGLGPAGRFVAAHSRWELLAVLARALFASARGLPRAWREREIIQRKRRISILSTLLWIPRYSMGLREAAFKE